MFTRRTVPAFLHFALLSCLVGGLSLEAEEWIFIDGFGWQLDPHAPAISPLIKHDHRPGDPDTFTKYRDPIYRDDDFVQEDFYDFSFDYDDDAWYNSGVNYFDDDWWYDSQTKASSGAFDSPDDW